MPPPERDQLAEQLTADLTAGSISATLISPIITIIDRTVAERTSSEKPLLSTLYTHAFSSISKPKQFYFSKPFFIVWSLYASTYTVANSTDTVLRHHPSLTDGSNNNVFTKTATTLSFLPTYIVNISLGIFKDIKFAQYYSSSSSSSFSSSHSPASTIGRTMIKPPTAATTTTTTASITPSTTTMKIPLAAYTIFLLRDSVTIASSFTLAPWLATSTSILDPVSTDPHIKATIAQLAVPAASQFVATPLHLLGLDLVGRPGPGRLLERVERIRRDWVSASSVRAVRILPAFGVGCVVNTELREWSMMVYGRGLGERVKM